jgi:glutamate-ammonia-ligase adenylyltransferase
MEQHHTRIMIETYVHAALDTLDAPLVRRGEERWRERAIETGEAALVGFATEALADRPLGHLLRTAFAFSPFLTQELGDNIALVRDIAHLGFNHLCDRILNEVRALPAETMSTKEVARALRRRKRQASLLIALADIAGAWPLERVTAALSDLADACVDRAVSHLLATPTLAKSSHAGGGLIILGMGKLGARELNYSSDIDLVVFYDDELFCGSEAFDAGAAFTRLARALVRILDERTGDGYVFRTDLRLRPDPAATPLAVSLTGAEIYYGSLGQNWERAAMIKARQVAGDAASGDKLFAFLRPWVWRRDLDFAAIEDIHSIKRQINHHKVGPAQSGFLNYNVKLGHGGIREIEFFAQTQQLIFGGRDQALRVPGTCAALAALAAAGRIEAAAAQELTTAYRFLRTVEHRLQMIDDQQTHSLPTTDSRMDQVARFLGFPNRPEFLADLAVQVGRVRDHFAALFQKASTLSGPGNLVFTGVDDDPETLQTLGELGFENARGIAAAIRGWHHGRYRAMRSVRAREIVTKLTPALLASLARTAEPDSAFLHFDAFLGALPAGVTVLSLLAENSHLLDLVGRIMGMAPALSRQLGQSPALFDELLTSDFFAPLPDRTALAIDLDNALALARDYEDSLLRLRRWVAGRKFQAGVHILEAISDGVEAGRFLADVAEASLSRVLPLVEAEFADRNGRIAGGGLVVVAFGRLGGRVMSFTSDLDLVTVYDAPDGAVSDHRRGLHASAYYTRLTQRLVAAISAPMAEGKLYEVDLRLRPSGESGPVATSLSAFDHYHAESAWTWEHLALTRARTVAGAAALRDSVENLIRQTLTSARDPDRLRADVIDMRRRIAEQRKPRSRWDMKYTPGGLIDIEFALQYLMLREAHSHPGLLTTETERQLHYLLQAGIIGSETALDLDRALRLAWRVQGLIRLTTDRGFDPAEAPAAILARLAREVASAALPEPSPEIDFGEAETILESIMAASRLRYHEVLGTTPETTLTS